MDRHAAQAFALIPRYSAQAFNMKNLLIAVALLFSSAAPVDAMGRYEETTTRSM